MARGPTHSLSSLLHHSIYLTPTQNVRCTAQCLCGWRSGFEAHMFSSPVYHIVQTMTDCTNREPDSSFDRYMFECECIRLCVGSLLIQCWQTDKYVTWQPLMEKSNGVIFARPFCFYFPPYTRRNGHLSSLHFCLIKQHLSVLFPPLNIHTHQHVT